MSSHYPERDVYNADAACALPGWAAAVLLSATDREADISCRRSAAHRRVTLPVGTPMCLTWGNGDG